MYIRKKYARKISPGSSYGSKKYVNIRYALRVFLKVFIESPLWEALIHAIRDMYPRAVPTYSKSAPPSSNPPTEVGTHWPYTVLTTAWESRVKNGRRCERARHETYSRTWRFVRVSCCARVCQAFACRVSIASSRKPRRCCTAQRNGRTRALAQANAFLKRNRIIPPNISEKIESGNRVRLDPRSRVRRFASPPPLPSPLPCEASVAVVRETPSR